MSRQPSAGRPLSGAWLVRQGAFFGLAGALVLATPAALAQTVSPPVASSAFITSSASCDPGTRDMRCPSYAGFTPRVGGMDGMGDSAPEPESGLTPLSPASPPPAAAPASPDTPVVAPPARRRGAVRPAAPRASPARLAGRELGRGSASWYGPGFHGRTTANGERFNMHELTAAHKTLPFGTRVVVHNPRNGKQVVVRINDRGPYARGRIIDLSYAAAKAVGLKSRGHGLVVLREAAPKAPRTRHRRAAPAGSAVDVAEAGGPSI